MLNFTHTHPREARPLGPFRFALAWLTETVFVTDMMLVGLLVMIAILGGLNPFSSWLMTAVVVVTLVIVPLHAILMRRHPREMRDSTARHASRERRGF